MNSSKRIKRCLSLALAAILALSLLVSCSGGSKDVKPIGPYTLSDAPTNYVLIAVEDYGQIVIELYPEIAPITVANFQKLVSEKFYDGIIFHRVIHGFMIQGGDPKGTGMGGSGTTIKGEFTGNGVENDLSHKRGVVSMARNGYDMDSASSQFFIVHKDSTYLDGEYAAFGSVVWGMETVDKIATVKTNVNDKPTKNVTMTAVRFVTPNEQ